MCPPHPASLPHPPPPDILPVAQVATQTSLSTPSFRDVLVPLGSERTHPWYRGTFCFHSSLSAAQAVHCWENQFLCFPGRTRNCTFQDPFWQAWPCVILWFMVRNVNLVFDPISGTELSKALGFPKWWEQLKCHSLPSQGDFWTSPKDGGLLASLW